MNRIHLGRDDRISRARRLLSRVKREAAAITDASGGLVHVFPPTAKELLVGNVECSFLLDYELAGGSVGNLAAHIAGELRALGSRMQAAANALEALATERG